MASWALLTRAAVQGWADSGDLRAGLADWSKLRLAGCCAQAKVQGTDLTGARLRLLYWIPLPKMVAWASGDTSGFGFRLPVVG